MTVIVLWLFLMVLRAGLRSVIVVISDHSHFRMWYTGSGVELDLSIPDLCPLSYFGPVL